MVNIITGKINSGKTTKIIELYHELNKGNGIVSKKYMIGKDVYGFNAVQLSDNLEYPFMIHKKQIKSELLSSFIYNIGPYYVFDEAISKIEYFFNNLIKNKVQPIYFDEVGMLELEERGFYKLIKLAISSDLDIYMTAREDLVDRIIKKFEVKKYQIISR